MVIFKKMDKYIGEVYEETIKQKLVDMGICRNRDNIRIHFEKGSSKFMVEFVSGEAMIEGDFGERFDASLSSPEVFKALKLRKLGFRFNELA
jgi:hypothetical protein